MQLSVQPLQAGDGIPVKSKSRASPGCSFSSCLVLRVTLDLASICAWTWVLKMCQWTYPPEILTIQLFSVLCGSASPVSLIFPITLSFCNSFWYVPAF